MGYQLGVDLGTTFTAAAVAVEDRVEVATLGEHAPKVPSVLFLTDADDFLVGEAAHRRAATDPGRVVREFKRRFGDPAPIILGGKPFSADALMARLLRWTVDTVARERGEQPEHVTVCHPANWGPYKQDLLAQCFQLADLTGATTVTEPEAAAISYASAERVDAGDTVAVYDLGGGTFDAAVLAKRERGFDLVGASQGIEHLGGMDFDEAVLTHVVRSTGKSLHGLDPRDVHTRQIILRLRAECTAAKEALSEDTQTVVPVLLPQVQTQVRLTRQEFEQMIRPSVAETIRDLQRALRSAEIEPGDLQKVLLVGGSSRIPLISQMISTELRRPVAVDASPKYAVASGAAITARERAASQPVPAPPPVAASPAPAEQSAPAAAVGPPVAVPQEAPSESAPTAPVQPEPAPAEPAPAEPEPVPQQRASAKPPAPAEEPEPAPVTDAPGETTRYAPEAAPVAPPSSPLKMPSMPSLPSLKIPAVLKAPRARVITLVVVVALLLGGAGWGGWTLLSGMSGAPPPPPAVAPPAPVPAPKYVPNQPGGSDSGGSGGSGGGTGSGSGGTTTNGSSGGSGGGTGGGTGGGSGGSGGSGGGTDSGSGGGSGSSGGGSGGSGGGSGGSGGGTVTNPPTKPTGENPPKTGDGGTGGTNKGTHDQ
ncbi:Hsp70 family protein [Saccharopolyspora shandongensis]|uniref:Hsp70 family protein n=1 Tax=Saccharopolyspora shandongensis TaxID=418495 RepID=UPI0034148460